MSNCQFQADAIQLSASADPIVTSPYHDSPEKLELVKRKLISKTRSDPGSSPNSVLVHPSSSPVTKDSLLRQSPSESASSSAENRENTVIPSRTKGVLHSVFRMSYGTEKVSLAPLASKSQDYKLISLRPKVVMGDDGAEITLELARTPSRTPQRNALTDQTNKIRASSLFDADTSPSLNTETEPSSESLGSQMLCGASALGCQSDDTSSSALIQFPPHYVQETIQILLGNPLGLDGWCHGWQAWLYFGMEQGNNTNESSCETKEDMKRVLRNRAFDLNVRNRRIRILKRDLNPFDSTPKKSSESEPLQKTRSLSVHENTARKPDHHRSSTSLDVPSSIASFGCGWDPYSCGQEDSNSPATIRFRQFTSSNEDLRYDSDPEDFSRRRSSHDTSKGDKEKENESFLNFAGADGLPFSNKSKAHRRLDLGKPRKLDVDFYDDFHVKDIVQEFMNERFTLVWHRSVKPHTRFKGRPQAMKVWIERGQQLQAGIIQPKLVWRPVQDYEEGSQRLGLSTPCLESVELLDISRVVEVNRIDRKLYPLAKGKSCFLLGSLDRQMMFEASCESERDRIVHRMKLLVARFGSKVIVRDLSVMDEFFTSFEKAVPGEAPRWTQESKTLSLL